MESVEKQNQLFPSFHAPLGISPKARDSHIPTARRRPGWKSGKPQPGFPLSHAGRAMTATVYLFSEPKTKKGGRPLRGLLITFQDHAVLETGPDFRIGLQWIDANRIEITLAAAAPDAVQQLQVLAAARWPVLK